jgi:hypothetical protein
MMPLDPQRVQSLFLAAAEAGTPAARAVLLEQQCGTDAELRQRVEALLRAHDESDSLLDKPDSASTTPSLTRSASGPARRSAPIS